MATASFSRRQVGAKKQVFTIVAMVVIGHRHLEAMATPVLMVWDLAVLIMSVVVANVFKVIVFALSVASLQRLSAPRPHSVLSTLRTLSTQPGTKRMPTAHDSTGGQQPMLVSRCRDKARPPQISPHLLTRPVSRAAA